MTSPVQTEFVCPYCHSKNLETVGACMHECLMACRDCGAQMTGAFVDDDDTLRELTEFYGNKLADMVRMY